MLWRNVQSSREGDGLIHNCRRRKGTHGEARAKLASCGSPSRKGSGGAEVIWRGSTRGRGSARPSEDGRDGEGRRRRRPKQREQRGKGSEAGRNATRGQDNSEEGPPGGNPRADRLSLGARGPLFNGLAETEFKGGTARRLHRPARWCFGPSRVSIAAGNVRRVSSPRKGDFGPALAVTPHCPPTARALGEHGLTFRLGGVACSGHLCKWNLLWDGLRLPPPQKESCAEVLAPESRTRPCLESGHSHEIR